jgi:hypothetical protein
MNERRGLVTNEQLARLADTFSFARDREVDHELNSAQER